MLFAVFLFGNALVVLFTFYHFYYKRAKLPPGPVPLPFIGNLRSLQTADGPAERCLVEWRRQFGDVYTFWLGEQPIVCVNDFAKIVQTFQRDGDTFAGRPLNEEWENLLHGGVYGIFLTEGELWREHRRFALHVLRNFGLGKNLMQERILSEMHAMVERVEARCEGGNEVDMVECLSIGVGSIINAILFGYRFDEDRLEEFWRLKGLLKEFSENSFNPWLQVFQWKPHLFRRIPFLRREFERCLALPRNLRAFFRRQIEEHQKEVDATEWEVPPGNFVEAYLKERARREAAGEDHSFTIEHLEAVCEDLWVAGQETTTATLAWGLVYLLRHPQVQARVHAELDGVLGDPQRTVTLADRQALPYTCAVICEFHRVCNLVPLNVPHRLTRDTQIDGLHLKAGTTILPQISVVLADEKIFESPEQFRPERFLDAQGQFKRVDELIPFSLGKRQCLGESLVRMEMFLFTANLLNKFQFLPGQEMPSMRKKLGFIVMSPEFTCKVQKRQ